MAFVSTSRSSNRTGGFPASGSRRRSHAFAHGKLAVRVGKQTRPKRFVQVLIGELGCCPALQFVLGTQPLTQPVAGVLVHRPIGLADRTQAEVVGPPANMRLSFPPLSAASSGVYFRPVISLIASQMRAIRFFDGRVPM